MKMLLSMAPENPATDAVSQKTLGILRACGLSLVCRGSAGASGAALDKAAGRSVHLEDVNVVGGPVEEGASDAFVA
jgi:hypothetical protein